MNIFPLCKKLFFSLALLPLLGYGEDMPIVPADFEVGTYLEDYDCTIHSKVEISGPNIPEGMPICVPGRPLIPIDGKGRVDYININETKPMTDGLVDATNSDILSQRMQGYIDMQGKSDMFTGLRHPRKDRKFVPLISIAKPEAVEWTNIGKIKGLKVKGARPSFKKNNDNYGVYRKFSSRLLGSVFLEEFDYVNSGAIIQVPVETINYAVNGYPAIYRVYRDKSGEVSNTHLRWFTDRKMFVLIVLDSLYDKPYYNEFFFSIAKAVD